MGFCLYLFPPNKFWLNSQFLWKCKNPVKKLVSTIEIWELNDEIVCDSLYSLSLILFSGFWLLILFSSFYKIYFPIFLHNLNYIGLAMSFLEKENEKWRGWKSKHDGYMSLTALNYVRWQIEVLDRKNAWLVVLYGWNPWCMDTRAIDVKATWHPRGLSELQGILNGNILHFTFDFGQGTPIWKESRKEGTFIRIFFHMERSFGPRNRVGFTLL